MIRIRGFSLLELVVVIVVVAIGLAVAVPLIVRPSRQSQLELRAGLVEQQLSQSIERAITSGVSSEWSTDEIASDQVAIINPPNTSPPPETQARSLVALQGGSGNPHINGVRTAFAVVLVDPEHVATATAVVVTPIAVIDRYDLIDGAWKKRR